MQIKKENTAQETQYEIFLSYSREDREKVQAVFEALGNQSWSVFMDKDTPIAERWEPFIRHQLDRVPCVLVLWSSHARESGWVNREATRGRERKVLVHATLDGAEPPGEFAKFQASDLSTWSGQADHPDWLRLLRAVAAKIGTQGVLGTLPEAEPYQEITEDHLALTSTSWRLKGKDGTGPFPYQIHLRLVGHKATIRRVENVVYYFDPAYAQNRPDLIDPVLKAYVRVSNDWRTGFTVYELANGYSIVRAAVKIKNQSKIVRLSRLVDIMEDGPFLKKLYHTWTEDSARKEESG